MSCALPWFLTIIMMTLWVCVCWVLAGARCSWGCGCQSPAEQVCSSGVSRVVTRLASWLRVPWAAGRPRILVDAAVLCGGRSQQQQQPAARTSRRLPACPLGSGHQLAADRHGRPPVKWIDGRSAELSLPLAFVATTPVRLHGVES